MSSCLSSTRPPSEGLGLVIPAKAGIHFYLGFTRTKQWYREFSSASAAAEFLSLACPRERNQREGHPEIAPAFGGFASVLRGFSTARPCTGEKLARFLRAPAVAADPPARRRDLREGGSRARSKSSPDVVVGSWIPSMAPSSAAGLGGKARMFEAMDGRARAGPRLASSAGRRQSRVAFLMVPFHWRCKEKGLGRRRGGRSPAAPSHQASNAVRWTLPFAATMN
jgi:hypothetical protein